MPALLRTFMTSHKCARHRNIFDVWHEIAQEDLQIMQSAENIFNFIGENCVKKYKLSNKRETREEINRKQGKNWQEDLQFINPTSLFLYRK